MPLMRAKMKVHAVLPAYDGAQIIKAYPVCGKFDKDGKSEDNTYARYTPSGSLELIINNPDLISAIEEGKSYYLDFTEALE